MKKDLFLIASRFNLRSFFVITFAISQLLALAYYVCFYSTYGYLPSPFLYDKANTFMDFFNTLYWAINEGAYSKWQSVYPPLNFTFLSILKTLSFNDINPSNPFDLRDRSVDMIYFLFFCYLASPYLILKAAVWSDFSSKQKKLFYFSFLISTPMLFTLERGNLIIFSLFLLPLIFSTSIYLQILAIAFLINIKPYFCLLLFLFIAKNKPNSFFICVALTGLVFVITGAFYDENFVLIFSNLFDFSQNKNLTSLRDVLGMPSSISVFLYALSSPAFIHKNYSLLFDPSVISSIIESIKILVLLFTIYVIFYCSRNLKESHILALILALITNFSMSVGGYSLIFYLVVIPIFFEMRYKKIYILLLLLLYAPLDLISLYNDSIGTQQSYLSGVDVDVIWSEGLGSFLKPIVNLLILITLDMDIFLGKDHTNRISNASNVSSV